MAENGERIVTGRQKQSQDDTVSAGLCRLLELGELLLKAIDLPLEMGYRGGANEKRPAATSTVGAFSLRRKD